MGWQARHPKDPREQRLERVQKGFHAIDKKLNRRARLRRWRHAMGDVLVPLGYTSGAALAIFVLWLSSLPSAWSLDQRWRHFLAAPSCGAARSLGLAPARIDQPGYYALHDADRDGVACEPYVPDRNLTVGSLVAAASAMLARQLPDQRD